MLTALFNFWRADLAELAAGRMLPELRTTCAGLGFSLCRWPARCVRVVARSTPRLRGWSTGSNATVTAPVSGGASHRRSLQAWGLGWTPGPLERSRPCEAAQGWTVSHLPCTPWVSGIRSISHGRSGFDL